MILRAGIQCLYRICFCMQLFYLKYSYSLNMNPPVVLLAYNKGLPSSYAIEITDSRADECFEWQSANPEIVRVTPVSSFGENCSKKAIVSSVAYLLGRRGTQITATLSGGEKTLKCQVITDIVSKIEFQFLRNVLELDGPPEKLTVVAKDDMGHVFSSFNGLEIRWKVGVQDLDEPDEPSDETVIRVSNVDYEYPERGGLFSRSVLLEPLQLGSLEISASLVFSSESTLDTGVTSFEVVPNLSLPVPSPLYLARHTSVNLKNNEDESYTVNGDSAVVSSTGPDSYLRASQYGMTTLTYLNKNYKEMELEVNVVKLDSIGFRISDGDYRTLQEMKTYQVFLDAYDENKNIIHATDNLRFNVNFPTKLFHVIYTSPNGTYSVVQTIAPGSGTIRAEFKDIVLQDGSASKEYTVSASLNITVCQKLSIFPPVTLLPVSQDIPMQTVTLTVTGGTGLYIWALSNKTAATIISTQDKRQIQLLVYSEIDLEVTVTDRNNVNFIATAKVSLQTPLDIEAYPTVTEAEVRNVLIVPVALLGYEDKGKDIIRKFDDCSKADIQVDLIEKHIFSYEKEADIPAFGKGCLSLQFRCKMAGHSRINMEYSINNVTFKTTTILACYKPLKPVHPVRVAVLALGTSMEVAFEGGPRKWPLFKSGHYTDLEASNPDALKIQLIKDPVRYNKDLTVFRITCRDLGENTLKLRIGNNPSATLLHPAKSDASIKFICSEPHSLNLKLYKKKGSKPLKEDNIVKVPFYGEKTFSIDVVIKDSMGRKFANASSLRVAWDVSDKALANPVSNFDFVTHENAVSGYRKLSRNFNEFQMRGLTGDLTIEAKITSYRKDVLSKEEITEYKEIGGISRSIDLKLVSLRDINAGLYDAAEENEVGGEYCESDSCKS